MDKHYGELVVDIARKTITEWVKTGKKFEPKNYPMEFAEKRGVFTTLHTYPDGMLRGCIGYPEPIFPLVRALVESAISATRDPRFPPLSKGELGRITIEVSVLTKPQLIKVKNPKEYLAKIDLGKDGLIIEKGPFRGLLLPQVPVEWEWDRETFLANLCQKASLPTDYWLSKDVKIYKFQAEIFAEETPNGPVKKVEKA